MKKSQSILLIYDLLIHGKEIDIEDITQRVSCSARTAIRYIEEIKNFLLTSKSNYTLSLNPVTKKYIIVLK
ncbi:MAG: hypothetical protein SO292_01800 [Bacilli bacterium]|nr:hypothetical protein [Bacilli bacterium]MDD7549289.1 hypothetical protein [Bacilli bacterium]MDY4723950.1 hypothetical protein [Bacilli bacterium]MDY5744785.1 hypothetical protein [Bacilli bacterium]